MLAIFRSVNYCLVEPWNNNRLRRLVHERDTESLLKGADKSASESQATCLAAEIL